ncbi:MAG TPA: CHAD domain-containing protein [Candidatus Limnocylindrales bacterium]
MATSHKIEIEIKYEVVEPGGADRYLVTPELGPFTPDGPVTAVRVEDKYVDSAAWGLARAGFAARLRKTSRGTVISIKAQNSSIGPLQRREEIEGPADDGMMARDWPASQARTVVMELCGGEPLVELLTIRQTRRLRRLQAGDTQAEITVDEVEVFGQDHLLDSFEELEVELKRGDEAPLAALVKVFGHDRILKPVSRSKLARAVKAIRKSMPSMPEELQQRWLTAPPELLAGKEKQRRKAARTEPPATDSLPVPPQPIAPPRPSPREIGIGPEDSMPEAARKVLDYHFARLQRREAGTRTGADAEDLHDMRVATRRMRAAWRVFDGAFKAGKTKKIRRYLERLADRLGAVRDLDVLIEGLETYQGSLDERRRPGLEPLLSVWRRQRAHARTQLITELDSHRYAGFVREMDEFLDAGAHAAAAVGTPTAPHRVRDRAASEIWAAYEVVRAYEVVLPWAGNETLHDLRISTKWLRYALEFFGETLGPDGPRLLERVCALQEHLGCLHDADVAAKLARDLLVARADVLTKAEADAIGAYLRAREREVARLRRALGPVWRAVGGAPFRRALGRAAAAL